MNEVLRFEYKGQPGRVLAERITRQTTAVVIVIGRYDEPVTFENKRERVRAGMSFCHPHDRYDFATGVKQACRNALELGRDGYWSRDQRENEINRAIYSAIRKALRDSGAGMSEAEYVEQALAQIDYQQRQA